MGWKNSGESDWDSWAEQDGNINVERLQLHSTFSFLFYFPESPIGIGSLWAKVKKNINVEQRIEYLFIMSFF